MPLYEYQCGACGHRFESIQKFSDPPLTACPKCGGALHKLQSAPAFQFKGSGWYVTDYARKGSPGGADSTGAGSSAESKAEGGESTKPAEKTGAGDKSDKSDRGDKAARPEKADKPAAPASPKT